MKEKFPFGIDNIILVDSSHDFMRINGLTDELLDLIVANDFTYKTLQETPNKPKVFLRDKLIEYFNEKCEQYPDIVFFHYEKQQLIYNLAIKKVQLNI